MRIALKFARRLLVAVLAIYWLVIAWGTHARSQDVGDLLLSDKVLHFSAFLGLTVLMCWSFMQRRPTSRRAMVILLIALLYGVVDELTQTLIPSRHATLNDWLADCCGAVTGIAFYFASLRTVSRVPWLPVTEIALTVERGMEPGIVASLTENGLPAVPARYPDAA